MKNTPWSSVLLLLIVLGCARNPVAPNANTLFVIAPYRHAGTWVFDDPGRGLTQEPFVVGIPELIDQLVADIDNAASGFRMIFSTHPFPGHTHEMQWRREEMGGNWYYSPDFDAEGWICPALGRYFTAAPESLYFKAEPL